MPCEEYKRLESDKRMADENAVINSSTRSMWLAKSAELREYMGRKRSRLAWIIREGGRSEGLLCYKHVV